MINIATGSERYTGYVQAVHGFDRKVRGASVSEVLLQCRLNSDRTVDVYVTNDLAEGLWVATYNTATGVAIKTNPQVQVPA